MTRIAEYMSTDHHACDESFASAEAAALNSDWIGAQTAFEIFCNDMSRHFRMEEDVLFPALLAAGGPQGPVQMMHMEHAQMNDLIEQMTSALDNKNSREYGGLSETLLIIMQQHNLKEEQILYPIADRLLAAESAKLIDRLEVA